MRPRPTRIIEHDIVKLVMLRGGILMHQVNCQRVAGKGLALQIREQWPIWYKVFHLREPKLGDAYVQQVSVTPVHIASLYAQDRYGPPGIQWTDYAAMESALALIAPVLETMPLTVYVPWHMGCGNAGGDWNVVRPLIEQYLPDAVLVKFPDAGKNKIAPDQ